MTQSNQLFTYLAVKTVLLVALDKKIKMGHEMHKHVIYTQKIIKLQYKCPYAVVLNSLKIFIIFFFFLNRFILKYSSYQLEISI